jgi:hypothetical protein
MNLRRGIGSSLLGAPLLSCLRHGARRLRRLGRSIGLLAAGDLDGAEEPIAEIAHASSSHATAIERRRAELFRLLHPNR